MAAAAVAYTVCPKCGTLEKSGKASCCGRGGSWFGHCESAGSAQLGHTWLEGIEACKTRAQFKTAMKKQRNAAQQLNFERAIATKSQEVITALSHPGSLGKNTDIDMTYKDATVASTSMAVVTYTAQEAISATDWVAQGMCTRLHESFLR